MSAKRFELQPQAPKEWFKEVPELHPHIASILYNAGIRSADKADHFLHPDYEHDQHDPFLFRDIHKAVERIIHAREHNEAVVVYGDYDADGVCGSVLLYTALRQLGMHNLEVYLPHRDTEGYGISQKAIEQFIAKGVNVLITVDCGISNAEEIRAAKDHGIDVIITDHHVEPPVLPDAAYAILNPQVKDSGYPWPSLAGVGVAFKLAQALGRSQKLNAGFEKWLLDLVAISTITDCMPLRDENRTLMKYGLIVLNKTKRTGLRKLIEATHRAGVPVTTGTIAFRIGPWINAAGRMDHANVAVKLLLAETESEAEQYVQKLGETNTERQVQTEKIFSEAKAQCEAQSQSFMSIAYGEDWPLGLIGLVAGKLVSAFHRPAFVFTQHEGLIYGSGRSVAPVDLIHTLQQIEELFDRYGGHAMACGFTLKKEYTIKAFTKAFVEAARTSLKNLPREKIITLAGEISLSEITWQLLEQLEWLEPFGEQHPQPLFRIRQAIVKDLQVVGADGKHLRLLLSDDSGATMKAIAFGMGEKIEGLSLGQRCDVIGYLNVNQWNGNREIQIEVKEIV